MDMQRLFTYHIVNIKGWGGLHGARDKYLFTYHIVNIKGCTASILVLPIMYLHIT